MPKPPYLNAEYAAEFKARNVAELYTYQPAYSDEVYTTLLGLIPAATKTVLDAGCGPGKIARGLVEGSGKPVDRVDAVDFSAEMIRVGKSLPNGSHPNLHWQCAAIEEAELNAPYGLIVAGASLHWMDWPIVLPRLAQALAPDSVLALVSGDEPRMAAWLPDRKALIAEYSTNQNWQPWDMLAELIQQGYFEQLGEFDAVPITVTQTIEDFLKCEHSRASLSLDGMGPQRAAEFNEKMYAALEPHLTDGHLDYEVVGRIRWGKLKAGNN